MTLVLPAPVSPTRARVVPAGTSTVGFGLDAPPPGHFGVLDSGGRPHLAFGREPLLAIDELGITGRHNVANALAALALVHAAGVAFDAPLRALRDFRGLPHRMQVVARGAGITWIDDYPQDKIDQFIRASPSHEIVDGNIVGLGQLLSEKAGFGVGVNM